MTFKSTVFPGVNSFTSKMRVRQSSDRSLTVRKQHSSSIFSPYINGLKQRVTNWRVSPVTGQLEQRSSFADSDDPHSRLFTL
ncbi:hypothetical protein [Rouxiella sp. Mn2063]|uniref:hypothetical protein n=1 Tax=Rouxiella sp. Mn2063 TaxID=3395262 RepID=UPI003BCFEBAF